MNMNQEIQSPYRRGGDDGLTFGLYLSVMFFAGIFSMKIPVLNLLSTAMMIAVPAVIYIYLRRYFISERGLLSVSALWMHGIVIFGCGSLIACFLMFIYMRWIEPDYLNNMWREFLATLSASQSADLTDFAELSREATRNGQPVTPIIFAVTTIMMAILSGSVLSLLLGAIVKAVGLPRRRTQQ